MNFGLITRRASWTLTSRGWIILLTGSVVIMMLIVFNIHGFLAENRAVQSELLIAEGWLPDYALIGAASEFKAHGYRMLITTGGPLLEGSFLSQYKSYAEFASATLEKLGVDKEHLATVPAPPVQYDRTYESAIALRQWMFSNGIHCKFLTIYTLGPHARRSRLLFEKALGDSIQVGVIAARDISYDAERWWSSSSGTRTVLDEGIAYLYARLFFVPKN